MSNTITVEQALTALEEHNYKPFFIKDGSAVHKSLIDLWWEKVKSPNTKDVCEYCGITLKTLSNYKSKPDCVLIIKTKGKGKGKQNTYDKFSVEQFKQVNNF